MMLWLIYQRLPRKTGGFSYTLSKNAQPAIFNNIMFILCLIKENKNNFDNFVLLHLIDISLHMKPNQNFRSFIFPWSGYNIQVCYL